MGVPYFASLKVATLGRRGRAVTISNEEEELSLYLMKRKTGRSRNV